jgi:GNAT superfamily N-acetyltransferase
MEIDISQVVVRKVEEGDIDAMTDHRLDYLAELQGQRSDDYKAVLKKELSDYFRKSMKEGAFYAVLAELDGEMLAFGGMVIKKIPGDFNRSSYLEGDILNMYTLPKARMKGLSSMILGELIRKSREIGISKLALHTSRDGEHMYRKFGFQEPTYPYLEMELACE